MSKAAEGQAQTQMHLTVKQSAFDRAVSLAKGGDTPTPLEDVIKDAKEIERYFLSSLELPKISV